MKFSPHSKPRNFSLISVPAFAAIVLASCNIQLSAEDETTVPVASAETAPLPPFNSKATKAGRVITNKNPDEISERVAKIKPSEAEPFPSGVKVKFIKKQTMLHPKLSKAQERRAEKEEKERQEKLRKEQAEKTKKEEAAREKKPTPEEKAEKERKEDIEKYLKFSPREIFEHPAAATFPGDVPDNVPRVIKTYTSDNEIRGWQCTGVYAPPGEIIRVHAAKAGVNSGYKIRVGIHTDDLRTGTRKENWTRFPVVVREFSVTNDTMEIANPFGGMIYVFAPEPPKKKKIVTSSQARIPQRVRFQFIGIVEAPTFTLGETKLAEWNYLKNAPAPWAEFAGKYFSATIPSHAIRDIKNPTELITFWDKIIEEQEKLAGIKKTRVPADRIVFDVDSTGFAGHNGDTIVCTLPLLKTFIDINYIRKNGSWGIFFFLAKNRVKKDWTLYGNTDAAAAILALKSMETATDKKPGQLFDIPALNASALNEPKAAGTPELIGAYILPMEELGWAPLFKAFETYNNAKKPLTETEIDKYESLFALWSRNAKTNLAPYFEKFGFEYSDRQKGRLGKLKKFEPENFPPTGTHEKTNPSAFLGDMPLGNIDCFFSDYNPEGVEYSPLDIEILDSETTSDSDEQQSK